MSMRRTGEEVYNSVGRWSEGTAVNGEYVSVHKGLTPICNGHTFQHQLLGLCVCGATNEAHPSPRREGMEVEKYPHGVDLRFTVPTIASLSAKNRSTS